MITKIISATVLLSTALSIWSCEGFKILTLHNKTGKEIVVKTKPAIPYFKHTSPIDTTRKFSVTTNYRLLPDSSLLLTNMFTAVLFNKRIKEQDLQIDYLRIETSTDTITANNRYEIIRLLKDRGFKNNRKAKNNVMDANKNIRAIIVR